MARPPNIPKFGRQANAPRNTLLMFAKALDDLRLKEMSAAAAFRGGYAEPYHFDYLLEASVIALNAANDPSRSRPDVRMNQVCEVMHETLRIIRERWDKTGKLGASGDDMITLEAFTLATNDFWPTITVDAYNRALRNTFEWKTGKSWAERPMREKKP